jgi:hypothetical protein
MLGSSGSASDTQTIRIGEVPGFPGDPHAQNRAFMAGLRGVTTEFSDAVTVVVHSKGQLGTISSSRRYKEDIHEMGNTSDDLFRLRPVSFRYKQPYADGSKPVDYGLIAEEVADIYPDLVVRGLDGQVETVQYQKLTPMLLNELQKQHAQIQSAQEEIRALKALVAEALAARALDQR